MPKSNAVGRVRRATHQRVVAGAAREAVSGQSGFVPARLALALALAFAVVGPARAAPQGAQVVAGTAAITQSGAVTTITNSPGAIINWQSFSIGSGETTRFIQQTVNSAVLNRVVGQDPSKILGTLTSNGKVFLVNPNGVVFGQGAVVDTAGLVMSTLNLSDDDFKSGRMRFVGNALSGEIKIDGVVRSASGDIYLIAPNVSNAGAIKAENGNAILAAGEKVEIVGRGLEGIKFEVQNKSNQAVNLGRIEGNAVGMFAGTIRQAGVVRANSVGIENGKIVLRALGDVTLASGSTTAADATAGGAAGNVAVTSATGHVKIEAGAQVSANGAVGSAAVAPVAGGTVLVRAAQGDLTVAPGATLSANGAQGGAVLLQADLGMNAVAGLVQATGTLAVTDAPAGAVPTARGGTVQVLGTQVGLFGQATVDVSGDEGGGTALIGGDWQGSNVAVQNARATFIDVDALIRADARLRGDGGKAVVWAQESTVVLGSIDARGGRYGGHGGDVETSGKQYLIVTRAPLVASRREGLGGRWLLDPTTIDIVDGATTPVSNDVTGQSPFGSAGGSTALRSSVDVRLINAALDAGSQVDVVTTSNAAGVGDINVSAAILMGGTASGTLRLLADHDINVLQNIQHTGTAGVLNVSLAANLGGTNGQVAIASGRQIDTRGGTFVATGAGFVNSGQILASGRAGTGANGGAIILNVSGAGGLVAGQLTSNGGTPGPNTTAGAGGVITLQAFGGGPVTTGLIAAIGADATSSFAAQGGAGGSLDIVTDGAVTLASAQLNGGLGKANALNNTASNGGQGGLQGGLLGGTRGGDGGSVRVEITNAAASGAKLSSTGLLNLRGGNGGNLTLNGSPAFPGQTLNAGAGGVGGSVTLVNRAPAGEVRLANVALAGGNGGTVSGALNLSGAQVTTQAGSGGAGGSLSLNGALLSAAASAVWTLDGGIGGAAAANGTGGFSTWIEVSGAAGGNGGVVSLSGGSLTLDGTTIHLRGGAGGNVDGAWGVARAAGVGGGGGQFNASRLAGAISLSVTTLNAGGGAGGNFADNGATLALTNVPLSPGAGGAGGAVVIDGSGLTTLTTTNISAVGGQGGGWLAAPASGGLGAAGGAGGSVRLGSGQDLNLSGGSLVVSGGDGRSAAVGTNGLSADFRGGAGGAGGTFNLSATQSVGLTNTSLTANGGGAGAGAAWNGTGFTAVTTGGGAGGSGGALAISAGAAISLAGAPIQLKGAAGGAGGSLNSGDTFLSHASSGGTGGAGGSALLTANGQYLQVYNTATGTGDIDAGGGAGGAAGSATVLGSAVVAVGGNGGWGGNVTLRSNASSVTLGRLQINTSGGAGGNGGSLNVSGSTANVEGGTGGAAGSVNVSGMSSVSLFVTTLSAWGGAGGQAGAVTAEGLPAVTASGGAGGSGGVLNVSAGGSLTVTVSPLESGGGAGGSGSGVTGAVGTSQIAGGDGGHAGAVTLHADGALLRIDNSGGAEIVSLGGAGGSGGMVTGGAPGSTIIDGGRGGSGGRIEVVAANALEVNAALRSLGGAGGAGAESNATDAPGTSGAGGAGGHGGALRIETPGTLTLGYLSRIETRGGTGGAGGDAAIAVVSSPNLILFVPPAAVPGTPGTGGSGGQGGGITLLGDTITVGGVLPSDSGAGTTGVTSQVKLISAGGTGGGAGSFSNLDTILNLSGVTLSTPFAGADGGGGGNGGGMTLRAQNALRLDGDLKLAGGTGGAGVQDPAITSTGGAGGGHQAMLLQSSAGSVELIGGVIDLSVGLGGPGSLVTGTTGPSSILAAGSINQSAAARFASAARSLSLNASATGGSINLATSANQISFLSADAGGGDLKVQSAVDLQVSRATASGKVGLAVNDSVLATGQLAIVGNVSAGSGASVSLLANSLLVAGTVTATGAGSFVRVGPYSAGRNVVLTNGTGITSGDMLLDGNFVAGVATETLVVAGANTIGQINLTGTAPVNFSGIDNLALYATTIGQQTSAPLQVAGLSVNANQVNLTALNLGRNGGAIRLSGEGSGSTATLRVRADAGTPLIIGDNQSGPLGLQTGLAHYETIDLAAGQIEVRRSVTAANTLALTANGTGIGTITMDATHSPVLTAVGGITLKAPDGVGSSATPVVFAGSSPLTADTGSGAGNIYLGSYDPIGISGLTLTTGPAAQIVSLRTLGTNTHSITIDGSISAPGDQLEIDAAGGIAIGSGGSIRADRITLRARGGAISSERSGIALEAESPNASAINLSAATTIGSDAGPLGYYLQQSAPGSVQVRSDGANAAGNVYLRREAGNLLLDEIVLVNSSALTATPHLFQWSSGPEIDIVTPATGWSMNLGTGPNASTLELKPGGFLRINGSGDVNFIGKELQLNSPWSATAQIDLTGASLNISALLTSNMGLQVSNGTVNLAAPGAAPAYQLGSLVIDAGQVNVNGSASTLTVSDLTLNGGVLAGGGTLTVTSALTQGLGYTTGWNDVFITHTVGDLALDTLLANRSIRLDITNGSLTDANGSAVNLIAPSVELAADSIDIGTRTERLAVVARSGDARITNANPAALLLDRANVAGHLQLNTSGGELNQSGASAGVNVTGMTVLANSGGAIVLDRAGNQFGAGLALSGTSARVVHGGALALGEITLSGDLTLNNSGGAIGAAQGLSVLHIGGATRIVNPGQAITLANPLNTFGSSLALSGASATIAAASAVHLGQVDLTGLLDVRTAGQDIDQVAGSLNASGLNLSAGAGSIVLTQSANHLAGTVALAGGAAQLNQSGGLTLGNVNLTGGFSINTLGGPLTQAAGTGLDVGGRLTVRSDDSVTLTNGNRIGSLDLSAVSAAIGVTQGISLIGVDTSGAFTLINASGGGVIQDPQLGRALSIGGLAQLQNSGGAIDLSGAPNRFGAGVALGGGSIDLTHSGALRFETLEASGNVRVVNTSGTITQGANALQVSGLTTLQNAGQAIILAHAGNHFGAGLSVSGLSAVIGHTGNLLVQGAALDTDLTVQNTSGGITQGTGTAGALTVAGVTRIANPGGSITLDNPDNSFGTLALSGASATVANGGDLLLGRVLLTGALRVVNAGGPLTQSPGAGDGLSVGGAAQFLNGSGSITLNNAENRFAGGLAISAGSASVAHAGALTLDGVQVGSTFSLTNLGGDVLQGTAGSSALSALGLTTIDNTGNAVVLTQNANQFAGGLSVTGSLVRVANTGALLLGKIVAPLGFELANSGGAVSQSGTITAGALRVVNPGNAIALTNANGIEGALALTGGSAELVNTGALGIDGINVTGGVRLATSGGAITQSAGVGSGIGSGGLASFTATGQSITLGHGSNSFGGGLALSGTAANVRHTGALVLRGIDLSGDFALANSGGAITQGMVGSEAARAGGLFKIVNPGNAIALDNAANQIAGLALSGLSATVVNLGTLNLSGVRLDTTFNLANSGAVSGGTGANDAIVTSGLATFTTGSGALTLSHTANQFGGGLSVSGASATLAHGGALTLAGVDVAGTFTLDNTGGAITQSSALAAGGLVTLRNPGSAVVLTHASNSFGGGLAVSGLTATIVHGGALTLGGVQTSGAFSLTNSGGDVGQSLAAGAALGVGGVTTILNSGGAVNLTNVANSLGGGLALSAASASVVSAGGVNLSGITTSGTFTLTAGGGAIGQGSNAGDRINVSGLATISNGSGTISLGNAGNTFAGGLALSAQSASVTSATALQLRGVTTTGGLVLTTLTGDLTQGSGGGDALNSTGLATLTSAGNIVLTHGSNRLGGPLGLTGGTATLVHGGVLALGSINLRGDLSLTNSGGAVTQTAAATVGGNLVVNNSGSAITLDHAGNRVSGTVALAGGAATLGHTGALTFDTINAGGTFELVNVSGQVTQTNTGTLTVGGGTVLRNGGNALVLANAGNRFAGGLNLSATSALVAHTGALNLSGVTTTGAFTLINASGAIGQGSGAANAVQVGGLTTVSNPGGAITLDNPANRFAAGLNLSGGAATIGHAGALSLAGVDLSGNFSVSNSGGTLNQSAFTTLQVGGATILANSAGAIVLDGTGNQLTGGVQLSGASATVAHTGALDLRGATLSGALTVNNAGGAVTQSGALSVGGLATLANGSNGVTLHLGSNQLAALSVTGGAVTIANNAALALGPVTAASLTLSNGGNAVTQTGALAVAGAATLSNGGGAWTLTQAANQIGGPLAVTGGAISLAHSGALALGNVSATTLMLTNAGGGLTQASGSVQVSGATSVAVTGGAIALNALGNQFGGALSLTQNGSGNVVVAAGSSLQLGNVNVGSGLLALNSTGGAIAQTVGSTLTQAASASGLNLVAGAGGISLANAGNQITGPVTAVATGDIALTSSGGLTLNAVQAGGAFTARGTQISTAGAVSAGGNLTLAGSTGVAIANSVASNGALTVSGGVINVSGTNAALAAGGSVTVAGTSTFLAAPVTGQRVELAGSTLLDVQSNVTSTELLLGSSGGDIVIGGSAAGPISLTSTTVAGLNAAGNVTISGGAAAGASTSVVAIGDATVTVGGTLRIRAGSGTGAFALLDPVAADSTMSISANGLILEGGPGAGAYAAIVSNGGLDLLLGSGGLILLPGSGAGADAVIVAPNGAIAYTGTCVSGCAPLSANPLANNITEGGTFSGASGSNTPVQEVFIEVIKLLTAPPAPPPIIDPIDPVEPVIEGDKDVC